MHRLPALILFAALVSTASPAWSGAPVTSGTFEPLDIPDLPVDGHATMVRTGDGRTHISVQVSGLEPGAAYGSHVHNKACNDQRGGGHYQDQVGGSTTPPNELWPSSDSQNPAAGLIANSAGRATGHGTAPWTARPDAQSVVIHQTGNPAVRIACADLT
jgi:hypothetical protein